MMPEKNFNLPATETSVDKDTDEWDCIAQR